MPEPNLVIRIDRRPTSGVTAEGGDALAATLLKRAGFVPQSSIHQSWYRLHYDMGADYENEKATYAYEMLTAARCLVVINPSLLLRPDSTRATTLAAQHDADNHTLSALTGEIVQAEEASEVAALLYALTDSNLGTLPALREVVEQASLWADGLTIPGLGERLRDANRALLDADVRHRARRRHAALAPRRPAAPPPAPVARAHRGRQRPHDHGPDTGRLRACREPPQPAAARARIPAPLALTTALTWSM